MATKSNALANWHSLNQTLGSDCLRVASYNIHRCVGRDRLLDVERVAQVIRELGCDVIGLQEVDNRSDGRHDSMQLIVVTHLGLRPVERRFQVRQMLGLLREIPAERMTVVLGDINEWLPMGRPLRWLHGMLGHSPAERSFPSGLSLFALDRVWVRPRRSLLAFTTHPSHTAGVASDHLPVKALIATGLAPAAEQP